MNGGSGRTINCGSLKYPTDTIVPKESQPNLKPQTGELLRRRKGESKPAFQNRVRLTEREVELAFERARRERGEEVTKIERVNALAKRQI